MIRRPPGSTLFPTRRSSDLRHRSSEGPRGISAGHHVPRNLVRSTPVENEIGRAHVELQSHSDLVCRLLLEKKKNTLTASPRYRTKKAEPPADDTNRNSPPKS